MNKTTLVGFLMCLVSLYFMSDVWGSMGYALGGYLFPIAAIITLIGIFSEKKIRELGVIKCVQYI